MIDFNALNKYRENNRIEAKKALGGLPKSIWETYSAFANTLGGIILLGVKEDENKNLRIAGNGILNPEEMIKEFWDTVNNPKKASLNILSDKDVYVENIENKKIIVINVPRADRFYKPVYIDGNPITGTYRRNGEGDYRCTPEEYQAMVRDGAIKTPDMQILEKWDLSVLEDESISGYRMRMHFARPNHVWETLNKEDFLLRIGAVGIGADGKKHPTAAGLLMFGKEYVISQEFNNYFLDYQEHDDADLRWTDRIVSSSGEWSGNVYDFYFKAYNKLVQDVKIPFMMEEGVRVDDTPVHQVYREALAHCLVNADYSGRCGVVIVKEKTYASFSNPGNFRIEIEAAKSGGVSDPRNVTMLKMFNLINIGERAGSGIPNIWAISEKQGWKEPEIFEKFDPDRIILKVYTDKKSAIKIGDKKSAIKIGDKKSMITESAKQKIIEFLTDNAAVTCKEVATMLGLKESRARDYLRQLIQEDILVAEGGNRNRIYKLKR